MHKGFAAAAAAVVLIAVAASGCATTSADTSGSGTPAAAASDNSSQLDQVVTQAESIARDAWSQSKAALAATSGPNASLAAACAYLPGIRADINQLRTLTNELTSLGASADKVAQLQSLVAQGSAVATGLRGICG